MNDYQQERQTQTTVDGMIPGHWYRFISRNASGDVDIGPFQFSGMRLNRKRRMLIVYGIFRDRSEFYYAANWMHIIYEIETSQ